MSTAAEVKVKVGKMRSHEYEAWRSNPANREEVALLDSTSIYTPGIKRIDYNSRSTERTAVMKPCLICQRDTAVASDYQGDVYCSTKCQQESQNLETQLRNVLQTFANSEPLFYKCVYNAKAMVEAAQNRTNFQWTVSNLKKLFEELRAEGKLLPTISLKELQAMAGEQYAERSCLDPELGGWRDKIDKKEVLTSENQRRSVESAQPSFELRPREAAMQKAAQEDLQRKAAGYESRGQILSYTNAVPQKAPETTGGAVIFRNGRRMN